MSRIRIFRRISENLTSANPLKILVFGYIFYIFIGWAALSLPFCQIGAGVPAIDNLFSAASAVSTTGLATVSTPGSYTFWGQLVLLLLFQLGGLGYMTFGSFVLMGHHRPSRLQKNVASASFALPNNSRIGIFLRRVVVFSAIVELNGIAILTPLFAAERVENPVWAAVFHSVSAFCTAGFSTFPSSLEPFRDNWAINLVISVLSILGAVGFLVMSDLWKSLKKLRALSLTSRVILRATFWGLILGTLMIFLIDPSIGALPLSERLAASWFQSVTALTTVGYNTHPIGQIGPAAMLIMVILMIVGASPSGTGGGVKSTTVATALAVLWSSLKGRSCPALLGKALPQARILSAFSALSFYLLFFLAGTTALLLVESHAFQDLVFESASALGTVGLSRGITGDLTDAGKLIISFLMFIGRLGPLTFGLALMQRPCADQAEMQEGDIAL